MSSDRRLISQKPPFKDLELAGGEDSSAELTQRSPPVISYAQIELKKSYSEACHKHALLRTVVITQRLQRDRYLYCRLHVRVFIGSNGGFLSVCREICA
jgi:hypothetical protein